MILVQAIALALLLLVWPTELQAQECTRIDKDCVLPNGVVIPKLIDTEGSWQWSAGAGARADGYLTANAGAYHSAALTASASLAYATSQCRWVGYAGELSAYHDSDAQGFAGHQELTVCLAYFPVFRPEITVSWDHDLKPHLGATPTVSASRVGHLGVEWRISTYSFTENDITIDIFPITVSTSLLDHQIDGMPTRDQDIAFSFAMVNGTEHGKGFAGADKGGYLVRTDLQLRTSGPREGGPDISSSVVVNILLADLMGYQVPRTQVYYDLALGGAVGQIDLTDDTGSSVQYFSPSLKLRLMQGTAGQAHGLGYEHSLQTSTYSSLVAEDRLSGWLHKAGTDWNATLTGYAALTQWLEVDGVRERVPTGGISMVYERFLGQHLRVAVEGELARSFYALLDGQAPRDAEWAGRVGVVAGIRAGSK